MIQFRLLALFFTVLLAANTSVQAQTALVTEGPLPEVSFEGSHSTFNLRPEVDLPPPSRVDWNGYNLTFRWHPHGADLPFPPYPGDTVSEPLYGSIALVGGTDDKAVAFVFMLARCNDGYDPSMSYGTSVPPQLMATGEWVFDIGTIRCDD